MAQDEISDLREEIASIDAEVIALAARRTELAARLGELKRHQGSAIRDFAHEKEVVNRARRYAVDAGISESLAENLMLELIRTSLTVQEQGQVRAESSGSGRSALVVGGAGRMGSWFVRFLDSQGFEVEVADPQAVDGLTDWRDADREFDVYVVAAPLEITSKILQEMAESPPAGLVFDIGSLKTPLRDGLAGLVAAGAQVTSIHPMFGPVTELLSGRHVVVVDVGVSEASAAARRLFGSTMASIVEMDLDSHDRLIAYILGLSHALNVAFFTALAESGEEAARLADLSSTTFDRQLAVASQVAGENPRLYFEIQHLNDYGGESLEALANAVEKIRLMVASGDVDAFAAMMTAGREYLEQSMRR
jgi:chorismate mutase/prephenate dehydrogenase